MRETIAVFGAALLGASAVTWGGVARAQQQIAPFYTLQNDAAPPGLTHPDVGYGMEDYYKRGLPAPTQAFELKLGDRLHPGLRDGRVPMSGSPRWPGRASGSTWTSTTG